MEGRRFSDVLHQALEAKENVEIQSENQTLASITYQNYFRLYKKLSGMTGTALTEAEEFYDIYKLKTVSIPTNMPMIRKDLNDQIFRTSKEKYLAITNKIEECHKNNQPVLETSDAWINMFPGTPDICEKLNMARYLRKLDFVLQETGSNLMRRIPVTYVYPDDKETLVMKINREFSQNRSSVEFGKTKTTSTTL